MTDDQIKTKDIKLYQEIANMHAYSNYGLLIGQSYSHPSKSFCACCQPIHEKVLKEDNGKTKTFVCPISGVTETRF